MLKRFKASYPNEAAILIAFGLAIFAYASISVFETDSKSVAMRVIYIAATYLLMFDVLEAAAAARGTSRNFRNIHDWIYAFYMGYYWCILMVLISWDGSESIGRLLFLWSPAGLVFGIVIAFTAEDRQQVGSGRFDLDKPPFRSPLGFLYYTWPVILLFIAGWTAFSPASGLGDSYSLFQLILLGSIAPIYKYKAEMDWRNLYPRVIGATLLLTAVLRFD